MIDGIDALIASYENGKLTRRHLLQALASVVASTAATAQTPAGSVMKARMLHHVNIQVSDVASSETFYRKLLGLPASRRVHGPDNHGLDLPGGGLIILQKSDTPGRIDHFCVGIEGFNADRLRSASTNAGIDVVQGTANDNFYVRDPDAVRVQVSAVDWSA